MFFSRKKPQSLAKTFCILPWVHLETRSTGIYTACCNSVEGLGESSSNSMIYNNDMKDVFHGKKMNEIREALLNGKKHSNCDLCWRKEGVGGKSRRMHENERFSHLVEEMQKKNFKPDQPRFLDLKLGNTCNLKCRICSPQSSSKWMNDQLQRTGDDGVTKNFKAVAHLPKEEARRMLINWQDHSDHFWQRYEEWLPKIEALEIYGGEPFLNKRNFEILQASVQKGYSKNQTLWFNTNGTLYPKDAVENIFPHFKKVHIMLSLDGVGKQFEYQRHPAKWDQVLENFEKFRQTKCTIGVCLTVNAMNIYDLPRYLKFWQRYKGLDLYLNPLWHPEELSLSIFPESVKSKIVDQFVDLPEELRQKTAPFLETLKKPSSPELWKKFIHYTKDLDQYRNESFAETFPEFYKVLSGSVKV